MSYEDLKENDIFLPEEHWDELDLSSSVNQPILFASILLGITACILMVMGGGQALTWIGAGLFVLFLYIFTFVSNAGIENQNHIIEKVMEDDSK